MIKLNIQRFGHTNSTSNYELPQFVGTDKPQWLTDINQAFASIDTAIHAVSVLANLNSTKIGDLTDLSTDNKIDLVSAINEVDSHTDSNTNIIAGHTTAIGNNTTAIGNLTDLDTVDKADLVSAINEVDLLAKNNETVISGHTTAIGNINDEISNMPDFNLNRFETLSFTGADNFNFNLTLATNDDASIFKLYGYSNYTPSRIGTITATASSRLRPTEAYNIEGVGLAIPTFGGGIIRPVTLQVATNGTITISVYNDQTSAGMIMNLPPCVYFNRNFGD